MRLGKHLGTFLLALGGLGLLACGTENRFERLAEALRNPADISAEFDLRVPFEIEFPTGEPEQHVTFEFPEGPVDLYVNRTFDRHEIRLEWKKEPIFEQVAHWDTGLAALRFFGTDLDPGLGAREEEATMLRYMIGCNEEKGWHCYVEALDVLAHLGLAGTDVYPTLELERAVLGLELLAPLAEP